MAFKPWLDTDDIIESVKRKVAMPIYQSTFSEEDILHFANEEMMISQVPSVLSYHEEYLVTTLEVPLRSNISRYPIPERAVGLRLRDLFYKDINGDLSEMTRIAQDDRAWFQGTSTGSEVYRYYLQGNDVILSPDISANPVGSLLFVYYLRPNQLVKTDRAAISTSFVKTITITNGSLVAGNTVTIDSEIFTAVVGAPSAGEFQIGGTSTITASNLASAINSNGIAEAISNSNVTSVYYSALDTTISSSNSPALTVQSTQGIEFDAVPSNLAERTLIDFIKTKPGHNTLNMDITIPVGSISSTIINFPSASVPEDFVVGDYISSAGESIIPQIPSDLHIALVERVCARVLSAQGDLQGMAAIKDKLGEVDMATGNLLDNRTEGSPKKITQRHSLLRFGKNIRRRRFY